MNKEQIDDLANYIWEGGLHLADIKGSVEQWFEQNPVVSETTAVGLTDSQIYSLAKTISPNCEGHLVGIITKWAKTQTFEVREIPVGLTDEQIDNLSRYLYVNIPVYTLEKIEYGLMNWLGTQTFTLPEVCVKFSDKQLWDLYDDEEVKEIPVGLTDEQVMSLADWIDKKEIEHHSDSRFKVVTDWLKTQTFEVREISVGLTDKQLWTLTERFVDNGDMTMQEMMGSYKEWTKNETFTQPEEELQDKYDDLYEDYQALLVDKLQLEKAQFTPDWDNAPAWANWFAQDGDGQCFWFDVQPTPDIFSGMWDCVGEMKEIKSICKNWDNTLQQRPTPPTPKVEVFQFWKSGNDVYEVSSKGKDENGVDMVTFRKTVTLDDFLNNFERVGD